MSRFRTRIGVVMPVFNAFQDAITTLCHIGTVHTWQPYIIPNYERNWCLAKAWNVGASAAFEDGCDFVLVINDDAFLQGGALDKIITKKLETDFISVSGVEEEGALAWHASCFLVEPDVFEKVGYFDENFKPVYFEDCDFTRRLRLLGYEVQGTPDAVFIHRGSQTLKNKLNRGEREALKHNKEFDANREYFVRKWGGPPGEEVFETPFNSGGSVKEWELEDKTISVG